MQNLKIYKKSTVMVNIAFFAIFTMLYLHVIESFVSGVSTFSLSSYQSFFIEHKFLVVTLVLFCVTLFAGRKFSKLFYLAFIFQSIYFAFLQYLVNLDKFILILNFFFLILSYYFYLFMNADLQEASNTPLARSGDLYSGVSIREEIVIKKGDVSYRGKLINWDDSTCFVKISEKIDNLRGDVVVSWSFEGVSYESHGIVVSGASGLGVGIRYTGNGKADFGWLEFYDIIQSRGYSPVFTA